MNKVRLVSQSAMVSRMGVGCMGKSEFCGDRNDEESAAAILRAVIPRRISTDAPLL